MEIIDVSEEESLAGKDRAHATTDFITPLSRALGGRSSWLAKMARNPQLGFIISQQRQPIFDHSLKPGSY